MGEGERKAREREVDPYFIGKLDPGSRILKPG